MQTFHQISSEIALFLDFDGTLVALAETPDAIEVPVQLITLLADLQGLLQGALAIVSGRQLEVLDRFLTPLRLPVASEHGLLRRDGGGSLHERPFPEYAKYGFVLDACNCLAKNHPTLLLERKYRTVALHYRQAPELEALCRDTLGRLLQDQPQFELLQGKSVIEVIPAHASKGQAIADFLREPPFFGRLPVFAGDDTTDESGFGAVQSRGGIAIKVGPGPSAAAHRLSNTQAVHEWLAATRDRLVTKSRSKAST